MASINARSNGSPAAFRRSTSSPCPSSGKRDPFRPHRSALAVAEEMRASARRRAQPSGKPWSTRLRGTSSTRIVSAAAVTRRALVLAAGVDAIEPDHASPLSSTPAEPGENVTPIGPQQETTPQRSQEQFPRIARDGQHEKCKRPHAPHARKCTSVGEPLSALSLCRSCEDRGSFVRADPLLTLTPNQNLRARCVGGLVMAPVMIMTRETSAQAMRDMAAVDPHDGASVHRYRSMPKALQSFAVSARIPPTPTLSAVDSGRWTTSVSSGAGAHS
jgi:hypothetical protein